MQASINLGVDTSNIHIATTHAVIKYPAFASLHFLSCPAPMQWNIEVTPRGGDCVKFWIGMLSNTGRLKTATRAKKNEGRNYTFCPILMKNRGRNTTFSPLQIHTLLVQQVIVDSSGGQNSITVLFWWPFTKLPVPLMKWRVPHQVVRPRRWCDRSATRPSNFAAWECGQCLKFSQKSCRSSCLEHDESQIINIKFKKN